MCVSWDTAILYIAIIAEGPCLDVIVIMPWIGRFCLCYFLEDGVLAAGLTLLILDIKSHFAHQLPWPKCIWVTVGEVVKEAAAAMAEGFKRRPVLSYQAIMLVS